LAGLVRDRCIQWQAVVIIADSLTSGSDSAPSGGVGIECRIVKIQGVESCGIFGEQLHPIGIRPDAADDLRVGGSGLQSWQRSNQATNARACGGAVVHHQRRVPRVHWRAAAALGPIRILDFLI
jgi:hypothetical protein